MNDFQKLANRFKLIRAGLAGARHLLRGKQIRTPGKLQIPTNQAHYVKKIPKVTKETPSYELNRLGQTFGAEKKPHLNFRYGGTLSKPAMEGLSGKLNSLPQNKFLGMVARGNRSPMARQYTEKAVNQQLGELTDKVWMPKGGATRQFKVLEQEGTKGLRLLKEKAKEKGVKIPKRFLRAAEADSARFGKMNKLIKGNPRAQEMTNRWVNRHELAERTSARRFRNAESFHGHLSPYPMLNDMNISASLSGPGAEATRSFIRTMRKPELKRLGDAVYPRGNLMRFDPRRLMPSTRQQEASFNQLQNLGKPGQRLSRHRIRNIVDMYNDAGRRNTYAFQRANEPLRNMGMNSAQMFMRDLGNNPLIRPYRDIPRLIRRANMPKAARDAALIGGGGSGAGYVMTRKSSTGN